MTSARERANELYPTHPGLRGAFRRGAKAAERGKSIADCQYPERAGWLMVWRSAWVAGFEWARGA